MTEALDLVRLWTAAEAANDAERLDAVLAENFVGIGPFGFVLDRAQWMVRFRNGLENRAFAVEEPSTYDHAGAVVVVGVLNQQTSWQGNDNSGKFRLSATVVKEGDGWKLGSAHIGGLQPPGPPR
jgi:hypothetical protein